MTPGPSDTVAPRTWPPALPAVPRQDQGPRVPPGRRNPRALRGPLSSRSGAPPLPSGPIRSTVRGALDRLQVPTYIAWFGALLAMVVIARLHEALLFLRVIKPALLTMVVVVVAMLSSGAWRTIVPALRTGVGRAFLVYLVACLASVPFSVWRFGSVAFLANWIPVAVLFLILAGLLTVSSARAVILRGLFLAGIVAALLAFLPARRIQGRFMIGYTLDPNDTAALFVTLLPLAVYFARRGIVSALVALGGSALLGYGIVQTGSRGGLLAAAVVSLVIGWQLRPIFRVALLSAGVTLAATFASWAPADLVRRVTDVVAESDYNLSSEGGRLALWRRGTSYFLSRPITGVGVANFTVADATEASESMRHRGTVLTAHNSFIQAGAELGLLGLLPFLFMCVAAWRVPWRLLRYGSAAREPELVDFGRAMLATAAGLMAAGWFLSLAYSAMLVYLFAATAALQVVIARSATPMPVPSGHSRRVGITGRG